AVATPILEEAHDAEIATVGGDGRRDYEDDDEPRPIRRQAARKGSSGVKIFLWIAAAAVPALVLLVFGVVFLVRAVLIAGTTPTEQVSSAVSSVQTALADLNPPAGNADAAAGPAAEPIDLIPPELLPGPALTLDAVPPDA